MNEIPCGERLNTVVGLLERDLGGAQLKAQDPGEEETQR